MIRIHILSHLDDHLHPIQAHFTVFPYNGDVVQLSKVENNAVATGGAKGVKQGVTVAPEFKHRESHEIHSFHVPLGKCDHVKQQPPLPFSPRPWTCRERAEFTVNLGGNAGRGRRHRKIRNGEQSIGRQTRGEG